MTNLNRRQRILTAVVLAIFLASFAQLSVAMIVSGCVERPDNAGEQICSLVEGDMASPVTIQSIFESDLRIGYWTIFQAGLGNVLSNYVLFRNEETDGKVGHQISLYSPGFPAGLLDGLSELGQLQRSGSAAESLSFDQTEVTGNFNDTFHIVLLAATPVPVPAAYGLLLAGVAALGSVLRRRKQFEA